MIISFLSSICAHAPSRLCRHFTAGTDANVFIIIVGENGDTGKVKLATSAEHKDKFERGHVDSFVVDAVGIGDIKRIHIGHDNSGMGPDWHCEKIEITVPQEGKECVLSLPASLSLYFCLGLFACLFLS